MAGEATLTVTITNSIATNAITGVSFVDHLPADVHIAASPATTNTCGGTLTANPESTVLRLDEGHLAAGATCVSA